MDTQRRLNIGCGNLPIDDWENIDRKLGGEAYPLKSNDGQPYPDASFDEVRASHVLEHFSHQEAANVVAEW